MEIFILWEPEEDTYSFSGISHIINSIFLNQEEAERAKEKLKNELKKYYNLSERVYFTKHAVKQ